MTQNQSLNVKLTNSQPDKLKYATKDKPGVTLTVSRIMAGDANDEVNFPYKLLLIKRKVLSLLKVFANDSSTNEKNIANKNI